MKNKKLALASLLLVALAVAGLVLQNEGRPSGQTGSLTHVQGIVELDTLHIPQGETLRIDQDLTLHSKGRVLIEGDLVARPRTQSGMVTGVSISITSNESIIIIGDVMAGAGSRGYDGGTTLENCILKGGAGGDIVLSAPVVLMNGRVIAGVGGLSGPKAEAPAGGSVWVEGVQFTTRDQVKLPGESHLEYEQRLSGLGGFGIFGGRGGSHLAQLSVDCSLAPGSGGRGGDVVCRKLPKREALSGSGAEWTVLREFLEGDAEETSRHAIAGRPTHYEECPSGEPKAGPAPGVGGHGTTGSTGANGSSMSPQGGTGGPGGVGGAAVGIGGDDGNDGSDCCSPQINPGGTGGKGASGQSMTGGKGGTGGTGGNGWWNSALIPANFDGPGGDGGPGGPGGSGTGGTGGQGGNGGKPGGAAGDGGNFGTGKKGPAGEGGVGGRGTIPGNRGSSGSAGSGLDGNQGSGGSIGGQCPE